MTYSQALAQIHALDRFGSKPGLSRTQALLKLMDNPHQKLKFIHIAGTNGKGSTTMYCCHALQHAGYRVGSYISPFVIDFRERIQINGKMIPKQRLADLVEQLLPLKAQIDALGDPITEFEFITALAFCYFAAEGCDVVCLEVGLGGLYDSTNVIDTPLVSVITSISMDHMQVLGDTLEQIAMQKCGIIKPGGTTVSYPLQQLESLSVIMEHCSKQNNTLILPNANHTQILEDGIFGCRFLYQDTAFSTRLGGRHQVYNAITAIEVLRALNTKGLPVSEAHIQWGLANTHFPARCEVVSHTPLILLDGAHNAQGAQALCALLDTIDKPKTIVLGMLADKEVDFAVAEFSKRAKQLIAVDIDSPRAAKGDMICNIASAYCNNCSYVPNHQAAIDAARALAGKDGMIVVCGSLYLAAQMRALLQTNTNQTGGEEYENHGC